LQDTSSLEEVEGISEISSSEMGNEIERVLRKYDFWIPFLYSLYIFLEKVHDFLFGYFLEDIGSTP
jgi:hypothetical protein